MQMIRQQLLWLLVAAAALSMVSYGYAQTTAPAPLEKDKLQSALDEPGQSKDKPPVEGDKGKKEGEQGKKEGEDQKGGGISSLFSNPVLFLMLGGIVLLYIWMGRSKRKQEAKRREMLGSLKKGDKVTSIGGIVGTVIEVREDEVTMKVDETNNVRMRFARWGIRGVGDQAKTEGPEQQGKR